MQKIIWSNTALENTANTTFINPVLGGTVLFTVFGSCYSATPGTVIGFTVEVDGVAKGTATLMANNPNVHMQMVPTAFEIALGESEKQEHTLALKFAPGTNADTNDLFTAVISW